MEKVNSAMEELYKIKEANSLRHISMTTEEINDELEQSVKEFEKLTARNRKEIVNNCDV